ncbi:PEPxxWA-CTERM sorting domain-containing protein [Sphingomonas sp. RHCKR7]|uniref:PEPxxWA-CTERM sorting domain-containing protein n=1 Tax=Sphingomonas folli TaxID=2862497 RepID=UPI001CA54A78|nr:PEPxxWA-CTERM sorting domain-containing protein [Sphingomonas folli]MBW6528157.1 PEPxxWA-CTERM sorting domain-containing protein [Sphingomonas folli]
MLKGVLATAALCVLPCSAQALTVVATGVGVIERLAPYIGEPIDAYGRFGPRGASLVGQTATITITVDLTATPPLYESGGSQLVSSGAFNIYPGNDPERTADIGGGTITINGVTQENDGAATTSYALAALGDLGCRYTSKCLSLGASTGPGRFGGTDALGLSAGGFIAGAPTSLFDVPTGGNVCERVSACMGGFSYGQRDDLYGAVRLSSLRFSVASVPEPSTWVTMILGFALVGGALRRRARRDRPDAGEPRYR